MALIACWDMAYLCKKQWVKWAVHAAAACLFLAPRAEAGVSATGGNYTNDIPGYRIHVFTNSATASNFVVAADGGGTVEYLVIGGGGPSTSSGQGEKRFTTDKHRWKRRDGDASFPLRR